MDAHQYNVDLNWETTRRGKISSPELNQIIEVATPPEFPKGIKNIWSPEHLFTASISSCFMTTFLAIAATSKLNFVTFKCSAKGKLEKVNNNYLMTKITLQPVLEIVDIHDTARALRILEKSEKVCLISNSITSKVILEPQINATN